MKIGFIGAGKIAQAIAKGLLVSGTVGAESILASCPKSDNHVLQLMGSLGVRTSHDNKKVVQSSDVVVVAVKPNVVPKILAEVSSTVSRQHLFLSVALGVPIQTMEKALPPKSRVVRVMPNTPALVRQSASVYCLGSNVLETDEELVCNLLDGVGTSVQIPESLMDCATGLAGSGPAYGYVVIQALADGGVKMGMPRSLALRLAATSIMGAAKMILETNQHPDSLKDDVCSPAGCTIHSIHHLERTGLRSSLIGAVQVATERSEQLGTQNS